MEIFYHRFNELLVDTFRCVLRVEEKSLRNTHNMDLSISELHLLEAVGKDRETGRKISEIARDLGITMPSVTVAINKLVKRGYVQKGKGERDARVVYVKLTRLGRKMDSAHRRFHEQMVRSFLADFGGEEQAVLYRGVSQLNQFLRIKIAEMEA